MANCHGLSVEYLQAPRVALLAPSARAAYPTVSLPRSISTPSRSYISSCRYNGKGVDANEGDAGSTNYYAGTERCKGYFISAPKMAGATSYTGVPKPGKIGSKQERTFVPRLRPGNLFESVENPLHLKSSRDRNIGWLQEAAESNPWLMNLPFPESGGQQELRRLRSQRRR